VVGVEIADIAFSIDSILAAVAMSDGLPNRLNAVRFWILPLKLWVVYLGGVLGIVTMRFVAGLFLIVLKRFSGLATGAYVLVFWIGLELTGSGFNNALHPPVVPGAPPPVSPAWWAFVPHWAFKVPLEMADWVFWAGMVVIIVISMLYQPSEKGAGNRPATGAGEEGNPDTIPG
jgi:predicted tellurium resistance membrane protein TerC